MSFSPPVRCQVVRRRLLTATDHVWITDDLLANALHRFTLSHCSRRHVSFAPGPLEARKRSSKRRMNNMAVAGGVRATDVGTLMGLGGGLEQSAWRWESPTTPIQSPLHEEAKREIPPLPPWLTDFQPSTVAKSQTMPKKAKSRGLASAIGPASRGSSPRRTMKHMEGLNTCNNVVEIRKLLKSLGIKVEQKATCSRLAFSRLLDARVPLQSLLEFLDDTFLNAPEAQNLQQLLGRIPKRDPNEQDLEMLGTWVRRHVSLGGIPEKDVESVLNSVYYFGSGDCHRNLGALIATSVWDGLRSSFVLKPKNVEAKTFNSLLEYISRGECFNRIQSVGKSIVRSLPISQLHDMQPGIAAFLRSWIFALRTSTGTRAYKLVLSEDRAAIVQFIRILPPQVACATLGMVITKELMAAPIMSREYQALLVRIVHLLEILPRQIANSIAASATSDISMRHQQALRNGREGLELLEPWSRTLSMSDVFRQSISWSPEWRAFENRLSEWTMQTPYLKGLSDCERCRFILRHWIVGDAGVLNVGETPSVVSEALTCFEGLNKAEYGTAPYGHMLRALRSNTASYDRILPRLFSLLSSLDGIQTTVNLIRRMHEYRLPIDARTLSFVITDYCRTKPASALTLFGTHSRLSLQGCPELAESIIADPDIDPDTVFHHLRLKRRTRRVLNTSSTYPNASVLSDAQVRLMHRMALAYANATHLKPRIALRFVHRCYMMLRRGGGGNLGPQLSRALTVAGIIRPLKGGEWVSTMKLRSILALVKDIEGEETAIELDETVYDWRGQVVRAIQAKRRDERAFRTWNELQGPDSVLQRQEVPAEVMEVYPA